MLTIFKALLFVALSSSSIAISAQTDIDPLIGAPKGTPQIPVRYGYVNLNTGDLHLEIPLVSMTERGSGPSTMSLSYNSMYWNSMYQNDQSGLGGNPISPPYQDSYWSIAYNSGLESIGTAYPINVFTSSCGSGFYGTIETYGIWQMADSNGTLHTFTPGSTNTQNCATAEGQPEFPNGYGTLTASGQATDGSGYFISITNGDSPRVYAPDGTTYGGTTNGNEAYLNSNLQGSGQESPGTGDDVASGVSAGCNGYHSVAQPYTPKASQTCQLTYRPLNGSSGTAISYTLVYEYVPVCTAFYAKMDATHQAYDYCGGIWAVQSLTMPDGVSTYTFSYDTGTTPGHYGQLTSMTLPTGGTVSYSYYAPTEEGTTYQSDVREDIETVTDNGGTTKFNRTFCSSAPTYCVTPFQTATISYPSHVVDPSKPGTMAQDQTIYTMSQSASQNDVTPTMITEQDSLNGVLTTTKTWDTTVIGKPAYVQTTWNQTNAVDRIQYTYATGDVVSEADEYVNGALYRSVVKTYQQDTSTIKYVSQYHMVSYPTLTQVLDGAGNLIAQESRTYDEYGASYCNVTPPGVLAIPMLTNITGAIGHDDINGGSSRWARGNPTTITTGVSTDTKITKHNCYDTLGNVTETVDGNGKPTSFSYVDNYTDTNCILASTSTYALPTLITDALGHQTKMSYNSCMRAPIQVQNANDLAQNQTGTMHTYDTGGRPLCTSAPDGGQTCVSYTNVNTTTVSQLVQSPSAEHVIATTLNSYGNPAKVVDQTSGTEVDKSYDASGRLNTVSNAYSSGGSASGVTSYAYDGFGRTTAVLLSDGTSEQYSSYSGQNVTNTDPSGIQHQMNYSADGRLTSVLELGSTAAPLNYETDYNYNVLGDLVGVVQHGASTDVPRARSFTYDSMSHLVCASNPENSSAACPTSNTGSLVNGTVGYIYDSNGNLHSRTDARGITTKYSYDALNRLTAKTYSDSTPSSCSQYDIAPRSGGPSAGYLIGNLTAEWTHSGSCPTTLPSAPAPTTAEVFLQYDPMGRVKLEEYCTPQSCNYSNAASAGYDLAGDMTSLTYPDGRNVGQTFDAAGRENGVNYASWNGTSVNTPYLAVNAYDPVGHPTSMTMSSGTGATTATSAYNSRLELTSLGYAQSSTLWGKTYGWTKNGNLQTTTDSVSGVIRQFGYDTLNRLTSAQDIVGSGSTGQTTDSSDQSQSNSLENSQTPSLVTPGWGAADATLTPNSVIAPDGTMTAAKLVANTGTSDTYASDGTQTPALYSNAAVTGSVWLRVPSGTLNTDISIIHVGDLGWGVAGNTAVALTTSWQEFTVSTTTTTQNGLTALELHIGGYGTVTNGQEIDIWGPQLQMSSTSSTVTNYIPYSQQIGSPFWAPYCSSNTSNMTLNTTAVAAPDRTHTATSFTTPSSFTCGETTGTWGAIATVAGGLTAGQTYTTSVWLRGANGGETVAFGLNDCLGTTVVLTASWKRYSTTSSSIPSGSSGANCTTGVRGFQVLDNTNPNATFYAWGAQTEVSSAAGQYVATLDSPITANANSTNFLPSSDQVGGAGWGVRGTVTPNTTAVAAPDGSYTADAVTAPTGGGQFLDYATNAPLYDGATVTASVYLCVPSGTTLNGFFMALENSNGNSNTKSSTNPVNLTSTWQRFYVTDTMQNGLANIILELGNSATFPAGQTVYMWGAQIVTGSSAGPPIETTDTTTYDVNGSTVYLAANGLNESYSYDGFGNILQAGNFNFVQAYTTANQLSGWSYDASGNLLNNGLGESFTYDAEGRIFTVSGGISYAYDAEGNRVAKSAGAATDYIYFGGKPLAYLSGGQWTDLIYGPTGLMAEVPGTQNGAPVYRMVDHLGTAVGTVSSTGTVLSLTDYAPFGQVFAGGTSDPYQFTGKERDQESGNDYFGARYYASSMGRMMSPDPGNAGANPANPQSWNMYSYALNNPLVVLDPTGMDPCPDAPVLASPGPGGDNPINPGGGGGDPCDQLTPPPSPPEIDPCGGDTGCQQKEVDDLIKSSAADEAFLAGLLNGCVSALQAANTNTGAVQRADSNWPMLHQAASANGVDPGLLAAIGTRESGFQNIAQSNGMGRGIFQIDLGAHPNVSSAQAFNPSFSANFAANMLGSNGTTLGAAHPNLSAAQLTQATAASYNFGTGNISGNPNTIDVGTTGGNYGSNVFALANNCFP